MNILYLRTRYAFGLKAGGSVTHTSGVINALAENHHVDVVTNDFLPEVKIPLENISPIRYKLLPTAINEIFYNFKLIRRLRKKKYYDAVYHRLSANSFCGAYLANKWGTPFVLEYNASEAWGLKHWNKQKSWFSLSGFVQNLYKRLFEIPIATHIENYNIKKASSIIVVSDELKRLLKNQGVSDDKIIVYPNGVDINKYRPEIDGSDIRMKYNIPQNSIVFGFIGSFGQWHGIEVFAKAIDAFLKKDSKTKSCFFLIGDGIKMPTVKEILANHLKDGSVILPGMIPQEESPKYLAACDVLVSPHIPNEDGTPFFGSPTKLFEYLAMGKVIIASKLDQIGEILAHEENSILTEPGNVEQLKHTISSISQSWEDDRWNNLRLNARELACSKYTWQKHVDAIINHIKRLA
ncbi:MAG: glycosyltransferase family 4 protein [Flavobacteriales bacterium]|nr:glycosyltransferase family 4 protein [Flavobacteriales bacterium]